jgi:hypothetical protein
MVEQEIKPLNLMEFLKPDEKSSGSAEALLAKLHALYSPEGPTETLLLEDVAHLRMQLQDADRRRQAVLDSLGAEAHKLFFERKLRAFDALYQNWYQNAFGYHHEMKSCRFGLEYLLSCWSFLQSAIESDAIEPQFQNFSDICRDLSGTCDPRRFNDECKKFIRAYLQLINKADFNFFLHEWSLVVPEFGREKLRQWVEEATQHQDQDHTTLKMRLSALARQKEQYYKIKLITIKPIEIAESSRFAYGYRANRESNESLRNIFADRRTLQQRHDQALRMLIQLQSRRQRDAARAAERAADKAARAAAKTSANIDQLNEKSIPPTTPTVKFIDKPKPAAQSFNQAFEVPAPVDHSRNESPDIHRLLEIEIGLGEGDIQDVSHTDVEAIFEFWSDEDLSPESKRFDSVFGHLENKILLHEIREIAAAELCKRHDKNKLLDAA